MTEQNSDGLTLEYEPNGRRTATKITARLAGDVIACERFDLGKPKARASFAAGLCDRRPGLDRAAIEDQLMRLAADVANRGSGDGETDKPKPDRLAAMPEAVRVAARAMLESPTLLEKIGRDFSAVGIAGERNLAGCIYLAGTSRLLEKPLAMLIQGPSSSGKSYVLRQVASLFPQENVLFSTTMSAAALYYAPAGSLCHKFVVAGERSHRQDDDQAEVTRALREMLSEGRLSRLVTIKQPQGPPVAELVEQEGPVAYCETTTLAAGRIFEEDLNRMLLVSTNETAEQTKAVLQTVANRYEVGLGEGAAAEVVQRHHAMQRMLQPLPVSVPYAARLVDLLPAARLEVRRGAGYVLAMVSASALLHQFQRKRTAGGEVIAALDDYRLAKSLLAGPLARLLGRRVSDGALRFLGRLAEWFDVGGEYTLPEARVREEFSVSGIYAWNRELADAGFVEIVEQRRGNAAARYRVAQTPSAAAEAVSVLPDASQLQNGT